MSWYIDAFVDLGTCRVNSMTLGPIPFTAIVEYSKIYEVGDFEEFHYFIKLMDDKLLSLEAKKSKAKLDSAKGKKNASK